MFGVETARRRRRRKKMNDQEKESLLLAKLNLGVEPLSPEELRYLIDQALARVHCTKSLQLLFNLVKKNFK